MHLDNYRSRFPSLSFNQIDTHILELVLDSGKNNPMSADMHRDIAYVWQDIDKDNDVHVVIVRGAGSGFSAGGSFDLVNDIINDNTALLNTWKEGKSLVYNIINCSKPIISAIHGPAVGAGLAVALLADIPIAAKNARLIDSHTKLGVTAGDFAVIIWPLLCGMAKAKYYLLTGKPLTGEDAERMGLVALSVDEEELQETAIEVARNIASGSPSAIRWTKDSLNNWLRMMGPSFDNSLALEMLGFRLPDIKEGLAAMTEKRKPEFDKNCPL